VRINTVGTPVVTLPEQSLEVGATRAITPVQARNPGAAELTPRPAAALPSAQVAPAPVEVERRQQVRRGEDRRKRQVAVLIDTRVGQRRAVRRRTEDEPPSSIDVEA
jgi:hypothetical protein